MMQFAAQVCQRLCIRGVGPEQASDPLPGLRGSGPHRQESDQGDSARRPDLDASRPVVDDCLLPQERQMQHVDPLPSIRTRLIVEKQCVRAEILWRYGRATLGRPRRLKPHEIVLICAIAGYTRLLEAEAMDALGAGSTPPHACQRLRAASGTRGGGGRPMLVRPRPAAEGCVIGAEEA